MGFLLPWIFENPIMPKKAIITNFLKQKHTFGEITSWIF